MWILTLDVILIFQSERYEVIAFLSTREEIMSFSQKHLDAVVAAIARGEKTVRYSDRTVEYRSIDELLKARDEIRTSLSQAAGPRSRVVRLTHGGKGL